MLPRTPDDKPFIPPILVPDDNALVFLRRKKFAAFATGLSAVDAPGDTALDAGHGLEVYGPPGSGKSHVCWTLIANALVGGSGKTPTIALVDCAGKFDVLRLAEIVVHIWRQRPGLHTKHKDAEAFTRQALSRLLVLQPTSTFQLLATLLALSTEHPGLRLVALDTATAFKWFDKGQEVGGGVSFQIHIARTLQSLQARGTLVVMTRTSSNKLPSAWQRIITHSLALHPELALFTALAVERQVSQPFAVDTCGIVSLSADDAAVLAAVRQ